MTPGSWLAPCRVVGVHMHELPPQAGRWHVPVPCPRSPALQHRAAAQARPGYPWAKDMASQSPAEPGGRLEVAGGKVSATPGPEAAAPTTWPSAPGRTPG